MKKYVKKEVAVKLKELDFYKQPFWVSDYSLQAYDANDNFMFQFENEIKDIHCENCNKVTEHEINPAYTSIGFGWTCLECSDYNEKYEMCEDFFEFIKYKD